MVLIIYSIQAALIFFTSATAVSFFGVRLSDFSIAIFFLSILIFRPRFVNIFPRPLYLLSFLLFSLFLSTFFQVVRDVGEFDAGIANAISVPFGVLLSIACILLMDKKVVLEIISSYCRVVVVLCLSLWLWKYYFSLPEWIRPEEDFARFAAFSQNPNQLALYLLPVPFFSIISYIHGNKRISSSVIEICLVIFLNALVIGKALFIGWFISFALLFLIGWQCYGTIRISALDIIVRLAIFLSVALLSVPVVLSLYHGELPGSQADQGGIRVSLWENGIDAWLDLFILGHGPGHYSGLDAAYQNMEAHNFLIDWLAAYGIFGGVIFCAYILILIESCIRNRSWIIIGFYVAILVQAAFHFYGRQPVFWLWLAFGFLVSRPSFIKFKVER